MRSPTMLIATSAMLVLAACDGGDDGESSDPAPEIVVEGAADSDTNTGTAAGSGNGTDGSDGAASETGASGDAAADATATDEELALEFAQCMRDNGVPEWPDPTTDADGSIDLFGGQLGAGGGGGGLGGELDEEALETCAPIVEGASFLPGGGDGFTTEQQDQFVEFAECLREQGLDVDDPDLSDFGPGNAGDGGPAGGLFGDDFDPTDPANADAIEACSDLFVGGPLGGG